jgi:hypothetical protein
MTANIATPSPITTRASPITDTIGGSCDQPKRWSSTLSTIIAAADANATAMTISCTVLVSAPGPARIRRSSAAGFLRSRYRAGIQVEIANTIRKTHACQ